MTVHALLPVLLLSLQSAPSTATDAPSALEAALVRAGERRAVWEGALERVPSSQRDGLVFLIENMPVRDLRELTADFLLENVRLAYEVRAEVPWGASIPDELFFNDVLPYANVSEKRDAWRPDFVERFLPKVGACQSPSEAAQLLNRTIFGELGVRYSTKRRAADQGPFETMESGLASCTGLSILLTDACRAVGVPARLAGIPSWPNKNGNHTWVEVWDRRWHFTGAAEPSDRGLDHAWFTGDARLAVPGSEMHAIYAMSWAATGTHFPLVFAEGSDPVPALDVTSRYAGDDVAEGLCRMMIEVKDGAQRVVVPVRVEALGEASRMYDGTSKGERADTNDFLTLLVPRSARYRVTAKGDGWSADREIEVADDAQVIVRLARP